jgi:hypothetical protein
MTYRLLSHNSAKMRPNHMGKAPAWAAGVILSTDEREEGQMWRGSCENSGRSATEISPQLMGAEHSRRHLNGTERVKVVR